MLKFCAKCGAEREGEATFCENCGAGFDGQAASSAADARTATDATRFWNRLTWPRAELSDRRVLWMAGVGGVAVLAVAGAGFAFRDDIRRLLPGGKETAAPVAEYDLELMPIAFGDKCGYVDETGRLVINPQFDQAGFYDRNTGMAPVLTGGRWGLIDRTGQYVVNPQFELLAPIPGASIFAVSTGDKVGLVDARGSYIVNPQFDDIDRFDAQGRARVLMGDKYGLINRMGQFVIAPQFDVVGAHDLPDGGVEYFVGGLALARLGDDWGYIDETGGWAINPRFQAARAFDIHTGLAPVMVVSVTQRENTELAEAWEAEQQLQEREAQYWGYQHVRPERPDFTVRTEKESWGYVNRTGSLVIQATFDEVGAFNESGLAPARVGDKWGFIDAEGGFKINPLYAGVGSMMRAGEQWVAPVATRAEHRGELRYGAVDQAGSVLINPQFAELSGFDREGLAIARMGENWGLVNLSGRFVVNPMYGGLARLSGSRDYFYLRTAGVAGGATEVGRLDRTGRVLSTIRGEVCDGPTTPFLFNNLFHLTSADMGQARRLDVDVVDDASAAADSAAHAAANAAAEATPDRSEAQAYEAQPPYH